MSHPILLAGDPHGDHKPIIRACLEHPPGTLILLGDLDLDTPLRQTYRRVLEASWRLRYVHGNHDVDRAHYHDNLLEDAPGWNISGSYVEAGGLIIGGLGGVFKAAWYPQDDAETEARWPTRTAFLKQTRQADRWKGGLPLGQRDTIFPEDLVKMFGFRLDVLVTHEAPKPHKHGFSALNALAEATGARLLVHGHHHKTVDYTAELPSGRTLHVRSLAKAEPWILEMPE